MEYNIVFLLLVIVLCWIQNGACSNSHTVQSSNSTMDISGIDRTNHVKDHLVLLDNQNNGNVSLSQNTKVTNENSANCPKSCQCNLNSISLSLQCEKGYNDDKLQTYLQAHTQIRYVTFQHSKLENIPRSLCALPRLQELNLDNNTISKIPDYNMLCFTALKRFSLQYNLVKSLDKYMLHGLSNIETLNLAFNEISSIDRETFVQPNLKILRRLQLQNNHLETVDMWVFRIPSFLNGIEVYINMSENLIHTFINTFDFKASEIHLNQVIGIDLRANKIRKIGQIQNVLRVKSWGDVLGMWNCGFEVHYNPFDCDCEMFRFRNYFKDIIPHYWKFQDIYYLQLHCQTPPEAQNKLIYNLPADVFNCYVNESCPHGAECIHTPGNSTMTVVNAPGYEVDSLPQTVPSETHIQIFYQNTNVGTLSERGYLKNVTTLDLSNSSLSTITTGAANQLQNVKILNFRECSMTVLPLAITNKSFPKLKSLDIAGNPFVCDCHMPPMKKWLVEHEAALVDEDMVLCDNVPFSGKPIIGVNEKLMICGYKYIFVFSSIAMFFIIVISISYAVFSWMRRRIMMRMIKFFGRNFTLGRDSSSRVLTHHITIIVAEEDQYSPQVDAICSLTEHAEENFKIYRLGYELGTSRFDVAEKLPTSEGCLFFMSSHTVQCNYSIFYFRLALDLFIRHYDSMFLIPILLHPRELLINSSRIPKDTKLFLQLFDSVDITSATVDLDNIFNELKQKMKEQVLGFPHDLMNETVLHQAYDTENVDNPSETVSRDTPVERSVLSLPDLGLASIDTNTRNNILLLNLPPLDSDSDSDEDISNVIQ